tara:strand:- start:63281 stop:63709 length:429 start_codon:yes stop_codon:yes gene_type:complete
MDTQITPQCNPTAAVRVLSETMLLQYALSVDKRPLTPHEEGAVRQWLKNFAEGKVTFTADHPGVHSSQQTDASAHANKMLQYLRQSAFEGADENDYVKELKDRIAQRHMTEAVLLKSVRSSYNQAMALAGATRGGHYNPSQA